MRQLKYFYATAALLFGITSCQQGALDENTSKQEQTRKIIANASISERVDTRAIITPENPNDITGTNWISTWENDDKLGAWTNNATRFTQFDIVTYNNESKTASFTGSIESTEDYIRFVYPYNETSNSIIGCKYTIDISNQQFDANNPFLHYGNDKPMVSNLLLAEDNIVNDVKLTNLCAGMEYRLWFSGTNALQNDIHVTRIELTGNVIKNKDAYDLTSGSLATDNNIGAINLNVVNCPSLNNFNTKTSLYSFISYIFPFELLDGESIKLTVYTNYGSVSQTFTANEGNMSFGLGKHHYMTMEVKMDNLDFAGEGSGTFSEPYLMESVAQMDHIFEKMNNGYTYEGKFIKLVNDINLGVVRRNVTANTAINSYFNGTFDGNGKKVIGLNIDNKLIGNQGLFSKLGYSGTIKNLHVSGSITTTQGNTGGIVGWNQGTIIGCSFNGTITNNSGNAGGIAGYSSGSILECYNNGNITGSSICAGGIVGQLSGPITACYNTGSIRANTNAGGIAGYSLVNNTTKINSCHNNGYVSVNFSGDLGGILGYRAGGKVTYCYSLTQPIGYRNAGSTSDINNVEQISYNQMYGKETIGKFYLIDLLNNAIPTSSPWIARDTQFPWLGH